MDWNKEKVIGELSFLEKKLKRRPTKHDSQKLYYLSKKYFGSWNKMMKKAGYKIKGFQEPKIPQPSSGPLYYFLGLLSTDGHVVYDKKRKKYKILLFTSYEDEKEIILELIKNLFSYNASVRYRKQGFNKRINHEIYISSKKLCNFFIEKIGMPYGAKSLTIEIPEYIKKAKKEDIWHFLRGVFDGDGSIIKTKNNNTLKIPSGSKKFIIGLRDLFNEIGNYSVKIRKERERLWVLKINKKEEIQEIYNRFYKNIGFKENYYPRKKEAFEKQYI